MSSSSLQSRMLLSLGLILALQTGSHAQSTTTKEPLRTAGARPVDIQHIRLDLKIDIPQKTVVARATLDATALRTLSSFSLDAVDFQVKAVRRGQGESATTAHFSQDGKKLIIDCVPAWKAGTKATYEIDYVVKNPKGGLYFFSPNADEPDVPSTVWSQGETEGNRHWIPCLDVPNVRQTTEMFVTVPEGYDVLSNGKMIDKKANSADKTVTVHWLQDKAHPSYLITLVVGHFDIVEEEWEGIPVSYWVPKGYKDTIEPTFSHTRDMLTFFSKQFGVRYPWDKYAQVIVEQFVAGGMENTSATSLTQSGLMDKRSLLDGSADSLVSHELAHQWWGDLLTCRDWAHIWLNEGWASFAEVLWDEHSNGKDSGSWNLVQKSGAARGFGTNRPIVDRHYPNPDSMFDSRAYPKGAWVIHMLRRRLGDDTFWKAVKHYAEKNRLRSVETSDFRRALEEVSGLDLERFFYDWTERGGSPTLEIQTSYDADHKQLKVIAKQTQKDDVFHLPLTLLCHLPGDAKPVTVHQFLTEKEATFVIPMPVRPDFVEIDPDQEILADIKETQTPGEWAAQLTRGQNVATRVRAARHLAAVKQDQKQVVDELAKALLAEKFWGVQEEIVRALARQGGTKAKEILLAASESPSPRLRRYSVEDLVRFKAAPEVHKRLQAILEKGDPSYAVEVAALRGYSGTKGKDAAQLYASWLDKKSPNDSLCRTAIDGLSRTEDRAAVAPLLDAAKRGKPRMVRSSALASLARVARSSWASDEDKQQIVAAFVACLEGESPTLKRTALSSLSNLGKTAASALPALTKFSEAESDAQLKEQAVTLVAKLHQPEGPSETDKLKAEVEKLKKENDRLKKGLEKAAPAKKAG
jgi:aminopeptidase N